MIYLIFFFLAKSTLNCQNDEWYEVKEKAEEVEKKLGQIFSLID